MKLTMKQEREYAVKKPFAVYSFGIWGIEALDFILDVDGDDFMVIKDTSKIMTRKIYESSKGNYINLYGWRVYLNEFTRV